MYMHGIVLGTAGQGGYCLAWIQKGIGVEAFPDPVELIAFIVTELDTHLPDFLHANAMFPGNGTAHLDTQLQDPAAQFLGFLELSRVVCVVEYQGVQITVAGMKNIGHRQSVLFGKFLDFSQHMTQGLPGYGAIDTVVIGGKTAVSHHPYTRSTVHIVQLAGATNHGEWQFCWQIWAAFPSTDS